ncbi:MAG: peroxide stress protein YaaA [Deefgea sp.]
MQPLMENGCNPILNRINSVLMLISPAKTLDYTTPSPDGLSQSTPDFIPQSEQLIQILRQKSPQEIASLMKLSDELAQLNVGRYQSWQTTFTHQNAKAAVLAFMGDVYTGLAANSMDATQHAYLSRHLRILSGLYGLLRPHDLLQAYRLEMGTRLAHPNGQNLYDFWLDTVTQAVNGIESEVVVNLASEEYFKVIRPKILTANIITPIFEDFKGGKYKIISFYAKRARGLMVRYAALNGITAVNDLKAFDLDGYGLVSDESTSTRWLFRRRLAE